MKRRRKIKCIVFYCWVVINRQLTYKRAYLICLLFSSQTPVIGISVPLKFAVPDIWFREIEMNLTLGMKTN